MMSMPAEEAALSGHDHHQPWNRNELLQTVNQHSPTNQLNLVPANTSTAIERCVTVEFIKCSSDNCLVSTTLMQTSIISDQNSMIISYTSNTVHQYLVTMDARSTNQEGCFHLSVGVTVMRGGM